MKPTGTTYSIGSAVGVELVVPPVLQDFITGADIEGSARVRIHRR